METDLIPLSEWGIFEGTGPCIVAGPCSAETREQLLQTASALAQIGVGVLRSGIWKPRTHPGSFEGAGAQALEWMAEARALHGMKISCEVGCPAHVEQCLSHGVDMVWIGARTTANPFLVQEIAEALRGADIPVLVKNPVSPDLELWMGAFERLSSCGIRRMGAVHRGVTPLRRQKYRNDPAWSMAVELRSRMPKMPLFCDPSHMGGDARCVKELSQRALDLGFEGLMIEVHCNPHCALSDSRQQLTPAHLDALLHSDDALLVRDKDVDERLCSEALSELRARIDVVDETVVGLLKERMEISRRIGKFKKDNNISIIQGGRWDAVLSRVVSLAREQGLSEEFVREVFSAIHKESVGVQDSLSENEDS